MTVRNTFVMVADSDQLNQGYFNGIIGETSILPSFSFALNNMLNMVIDGATATNQYNLVSGLTISSQGAGSTTSYSTTLVRVFSQATIYDDYSDATFDSNKFASDITKSETAGTNLNIASEGYIKGAHAAADSLGSCYLQASGATTSLNLKPAVGTDSECIVYISATNGCTGNGNGGITLYLRDESANQITLWADSGAGERSIAGGVRLVFKAGNLVDVYRSSPTLSASVDTSTLVGSTWFLRLYATDNSGSTANRAYDLRFMKIRYANNTSMSASTFYSSTSTLTSASTKCMMNMKTESANTITQSFDGGSNYASITNNILNSGITSGTSAITKVVLTSGTTSYIPAVGKFAYYYG